MITVLSYNVRQWTRDINPSKPTYWRKRAKEIRALIARENPDIILLQEATWPMVGQCIPEGYKRATGCSISHHIYCRKEYKVISHEWHMRWCRATIDTGKREVNAFSIHTRWEEDIYRKTCTEITSNLIGGMINVAGGDWNNTPDIISPLVDPMQLAKTNGTTFLSWEKKNKAELDYFACWPWTGKATLCLPNSFTVSDHLPVILRYNYA